MKIVSKIVLTVDDSRTMRDMLMLALGDAGFTVVQAVDGVHGLEVLDRMDQPDVIITDPPRAGMHEKLIHKLLAMEAPIIVYVSCNPATQARDLSLLSEKYTVTKIQPVDMFPHTLHIENVVQLKRTDLL